MVLFRLSSRTRLWGQQSLSSDLPLSSYHYQAVMHAFPEKYNLSSMLWVCPEASFRCGMSETPRWRVSGGHSDQMPKSPHLAPLDSEDDNNSSLNSFLRAEGPPAYP